MIMIIGHHYVIHGIMHRYMADEFVLWRTGSLFNKLFTSVLYVGGRVGVGLFFAITGYFMINKKKASLKRTMLEWLYYLILLFIFIGIYGIFEIFKYGFSFGIIQYIIVNSYIILPITNYWWFVTVYALLIFCLPVINLNVNKLSKKGFLSLLIIILALLAIFDYNSSYQSFTIGLFYYLLGGYIRKFKNPLSRMKKIVVLLLICIIWLVSAVTVYSYYMYNNGLINIVENFAYFGILIPIIIYFIFRFFQSIDIGSNKYINTISKTTFGIYLLHDSVFVRQMIWHHIFQVDKNQYGSQYCFIYVILTIGVIFIVCSICDLFRIRFIEPRMINSFDRHRYTFRKHFLNNEEI